LRRGQRQRHRHRDDVGHERPDHGTIGAVIDETMPDRGWLPRGEAAARPLALSLVVAWCQSEPQRVGQVLVLEGEGPWILGRGDESEGPDAELRASFAEARPGGLRPTPPLASRAISRRQLSIRRDGELFAVSRLGKAKLAVNGRLAEVVRLRPGDTVEVDAQLVLLCVQREAMPFGRGPSVPAAAFPFGEADEHGIVGESGAAWALREAAAFAGANQGHVLVVGATGTGKELAARAIHALSPRKARSFVARNAATLPAGILDAELFGNVKNYPNAGMPERHGLVGEADGGTLFLDEIGEMSSELQAHLLRLLDEGEYQRLGESKARRVDLRVVAATNRAPEALKHDLLARLLLRVEVPDLSQRPEDIALLIRHVLRAAAAKNEGLRGRFFDEAGEPRVSPVLADALVRHHFPANVRELTSLLWASISESQQHFLDLTPTVERRIKASTPPPDLEDEGTPPDREAVQAAMAENGGSVSKAAAALGLKNRSVLYRLLRKYGLAGG
jgi:transcriptional regulator with AAA-type ATPase domain